jgi:hypothetical protein
MAKKRPLSKAIVRALWGASSRSLIMAKYMPLSKAIIRALGGLS